MLRKMFVGLGITLAIVLMGAWLFWPKNFVAKGPFWDFLTGAQVEAPTKDMLESRFTLPEGFRIGVFAADVPHARMMRVTSEGDILVSSMREGNVILLHADKNNDGMADGRTVLMSGLDIPHGLALKSGYLYVAETGRIVRARFDAKARAVGDVELVLDGIPPGGNHRTRTIGFGPDGMLYLTVGSTCNVCIEDHAYRAAMVRMKPDGSGARIFARGLRNTVGFDWQPGTGHLYGTDNGRDLLGDDTPHCELNLIEEGAFYGWPYAYDAKVPDPDYGAGHEAEIASSKPLVHGFGAHRAPLGIRFLTPGLEPLGYEGAALVALHGSWNRSTLAGYKVVSLHFGANGTVEQKDFLAGFEKDGDVIGRPVDMVQGPDGAIYVSDDYAGAIYRISWGDMVASKETALNDERPHPLADVTDAEVQVMTMAGSVLFAANGCAACHDPASAADGVQVKELKALAQRYDIEGITGLLEVPPGPMPQYDLTAEEKRALAIYLLAKD
ncbi:MAG: PQQ-dependent sugar dehydrogenase [Alphaproteobacteria bacterium]|nr:PQQ-dependent sugar dehydrogenase [Alphaproteobacteria bacterium]